MEELLKKIKEQADSGKSKDEIYVFLISTGARVDDLNLAWEIFSSPVKKEESSKKVIKILVTIGAVLVGLGIFSFIASNWQKMEKTLKISIIILSMIFSYSGGWYLGEKRDYRRSGTALILLGGLIYGAGIFLIGQIFNIRSNWPDAFLIWGIGLSVMGFCAGSFSLFYLSIPVWIIGISSHPLGILGMMDGYDPFLLTSSLLIFIAFLVNLFTAISIRAKAPENVRDVF